jgi:hypothetical protein
MESQGKKKGKWGKDNKPWKKQKNNEGFSVNIPF